MLSLFYGEKKKYRKLDRKKTWTLNDEEQSNRTLDTSKKKSNVWWLRKSKLVLAKAIVLHFSNTINVTREQTK